MKWSLQALQLQWKQWALEADYRHYPPMKRFATKLVTLIYGISREFERERMNMRIMGLAYTTLLSLIPLLAVSFSTLKAFGVQDQLEPLLQEFLAPLGPQGQLVHQHILQFVDHIRVGLLGSLGLAALFYTVIALVSKIEQTFNDIWHVSNARSPARRFSDYFSVILIGPLLLFAAIGLTNLALESALTQYLISIEPLGTIFLWLRAIAPYFFISLALAFIYGFVPNTPVRLLPALCGGFLAGICWITVGKLFALFIVTSSRYSAIYSGFAGAILFILWLYITWLIIVIGAQITAYWQDPRLVNPRVAGLANNYRRYEAMAMEIMTIIGMAHHQKHTDYPDLDQLQARHKDGYNDIIVLVLRRLEHAELVVRTDKSPPTFLPARDLETIRMVDILEAMRGAYKQIDSEVKLVADTMARIDDSVLEVLSGLTLRDVVKQQITHEQSINQP